MDLNLYQITKRENDIYDSIHATNVENIKKQADELNEIHKSLQKTMMKVSNIYHICNTYYIL